MEVTTLYDCGMIAYVMHDNIIKRSMIDEVHTHNAKYQGGRNSVQYKLRDIEGLFFESKVFLSKELLIKTL